MPDDGLFVETTLGYNPDDQSDILGRFIAYAKERFRRKP
jgi:hypothetical protein